MRKIIRASRKKFEIKGWVSDEGERKRCEEIKELVRKLEWRKYEEGKKNFQFINLVAWTISVDQKIENESSGRIKWVRSQVAKIKLNFTKTVRLKSKFITKYDEFIPITKWKVYAVEYNNSNHSKSIQK